MIKNEVIWHIQDIFFVKHEPAANDYIGIQNYPACIELRKIRI